MRALLSIGNHRIPINNIAWIETLNGIGVLRIHFHFGEDPLDVHVSKEEQDNVLRRWDDMLSTIITEAVMTSMYSSTTDEVVH